MKSRIDCVTRYHSLSILPCRDILNLWIITSIIHYFLLLKSIMYEELIEVEFKMMRRMMRKMRFNKYSI